MRVYIVKCTQHSHFCAPKNRKIVCVRNFIVKIVSLFFWDDSVDRLALALLPKHNNVVDFTSTPNPNRRMEHCCCLSLIYREKMRRKQLHRHKTPQQVTCILTIWNPQLRFPNEHIHLDYLTKIRCTTFWHKSIRKMPCGNLIKVSNCIKDMCNRQLVNVKLNTNSKVKCSAQEFRRRNWTAKCLRWERTGALSNDICRRSAWCFFVSNSTQRSWHSFVRFKQIQRTRKKAKVIIVEKSNYMKKG